MSEARSDGQPIPHELLGPLHDATSLVGDPGELRAAFERHGHVLLRAVLDPELVLAARHEIFHRLSEVGEIRSPTAAGLPTGTSRRQQVAGDLGEFWKGVSECGALRAVTHGSSLRELLALLFAEPARPHDYVFLRPTPVGQATRLHYDYPFFAGGSERIVTCWLPLGEVLQSDGPLAVVEQSHQFADLVTALRQSALKADPVAFQAAQQAAYQATDTNMLEFVQSRNSRLLTADFQAGDVVVFSGFLMHGSLDNHSPAGRVRLSVDVRYQPAADPTTDTRYFGSHPTGAKGGGYGEQKAAQPLTGRPAPAP